MTVDDILAKLHTVEEQPSLFDHANSELSHESFLAYALDAFRRDLSQSTADRMAARFGEALAHRCLAISREEIQSLEVFRQQALGPNGKDRIDLMVQVRTQSGKSLWSIIETKLHAPAQLFGPIKSICYE
jgi:hypothetical protein